MKKIMKSILALTLFTAISASAQTGGVGIGTTSPADSAVLDITSENKALVVTRVTTTSAITAPVNGMIIYVTTENKFKIYHNNSWTNMFN